MDTKAEREIFFSASPKIDDPEWLRAKIHEILDEIDRLKEDNQCPVCKEMSKSFREIMGK